MNASWLLVLMGAGWVLALIGGLGVHVLTNFNGRRLEAYCRLKRRSNRYGEILDQQDSASGAAQYFLLFGLVIGSLAAGARLFDSGSLMDQGSRIGINNTPTIAAWVLSWLLLSILSGLWLPRIIVHYSSSFFLFHSWPLWKLLAVITRPFSVFGDVFSWLGQRLTDEPESDDLEEEMLEDEIRTMVAAGQRDGVFSDGVPEMIQGVMDLDENDVQEIMTPRSMVDVVNVELPWHEVVKVVAACGRTRIPVFRKTADDIIGILYVKDLLSALADDSFQPGPDTLNAILRKPWFVPANKSVDEILRVFLHNRNHMAIVVDDYRQFIGVVTLEDTLEEIVGEIADELDIDEDSQMIYDEATHQVEAQGKVPIEDLSELLGLQLPESDDYDTVGGLVIHRLGQIPQVGTEVEVNGARITVLQATRRLVQRVRVELIVPNAAGSAS